MSVNAIASTIETVNKALEPLTPPGVSGMEFVTVFLVIYAIVFLVLERIKFLKDNRGARLMLALAVAYFTASSAFATILISKLFPHLGMVTVALLMFLIIGGVLSKDEEGFYNVGGWLRLLIALGAIGAVIIFTWISVAGEISLKGLAIPEITGIDWGSLIMFGIFIFVIILIFVSGPKEKKGKESFLKKLGELFMKAGEKY